MRLQTSSNQRFLVYEDGTPFFYLGDTAWDLFYRLDGPETERYLADRAAQEFSVIEAVLLSEFGALQRPNALGDLPLHDQDPARPNEAFFQHVDFVVARAAALGLWMGLLPTWGDKVGPQAWGEGPVVFTPENAWDYGRFLGSRYANQPIIWILGGDRPIETSEQRAVWRAMADGIKAGDSGRGLMTFHPPGYHSASEFVGDEPWVDFFQIQTGHGARDSHTDKFITQDYARVPARPTMEGEWCYENHPINWKPELGRYDDWDVRKGLYWSLFAGGHGFTYGCNDIFPFYRGPEDLALYQHFSPVLPWERALGLPGAGQVRHARRLLLSRPFLTRIPDQGLLGMDAGTDGARIRATRDEAGTYAFVYTPTGARLMIDLSRLTGALTSAWWFDPRTGLAQAIAGELPQGQGTFTPPTSGPGQDWILVLDTVPNDLPPGVLTT